MPTPPSREAAFASIAFVLGFSIAVGCTEQQRQRARTVIEILDKACSVAPTVPGVVPPAVGDICVTTDEFRKAIQNILAARAVTAAQAGSASASALAPAPAPHTVLVRLPPEE